ncbi:hypothetical protein [Actinoalloteichus hymeniacidonis]|uniref:Uncharacterized protein n=1 Tax=Actinoalloteichus hymeniacidonis TaxID=340345 RepID=A0AAC9HNH4_9PSEU|nr:hypothetical protein [Actinoalloteichus hymeniacidonis]AOS62530.1 hypothetical protein TL08_08575 [Actinoalloteichus hymeniacidonis]
MLTALGLVAGSLGAGSMASASVVVPEPVPSCVITDPAITMLSGLVSDGEHWYVVNDHDPFVQVFVLNRDCSVERVLTTGIDHYDVGDLAMAPDGVLWVAETGDNRMRRETVALISVTPDGQSALHRLTYPDGPRDAEALLIGSDGIPYIVTKELLGPAEIYRPAQALESPGPVPLERVGSVRIRGSNTPGGPIPGFVGSVVVTGGSVHPDGSVVALRTYTDAYLFAAPDGDVPTALENEPLRIPLPDEPQGEAVAIEPDGTLLSGSEGADQPIRAVPDAVGLLAAELERREPAAVPPREEPTAPSNTEPEGAESEPAPAEAPSEQEWGVVLLAGAVALGLVWWWGRRRSRR